MRPSDHLLVLWQWDTAVACHRRAQDLARTGDPLQWGRAARLATLEASLASIRLKSYTGAATVSPAETGRGE